jgi:hypothetical protein
MFKEPQYFINKETFMRKLLCITLAALVTAPYGYGVKVISVEGAPEDLAKREFISADNLSKVKQLIKKTPWLTDKQYGAIDGALTAAASNGHLPIVKFFIEKYPKDIEPATIDQAIDHAQQNEHTAVVEYLKTQTLSARKSQLLWAIGRGNLKEVKQLCKNIPPSAKPEFLGKFGNTFPLQTAVLKGNFDIVKYLVEQGASLQTRDRDNRAALHTALDFGKFKIAGFLINKIVEQDNQDLLTTPGFAGRTPLISAVMSENIDIVKKLLSNIPEDQRKKTLETRDGQVVLLPIGTVTGETPLMYAVGLNNSRIVQCLIGYGATPTDEATQLAEKLGYEDILSMLQNAASKSSKTSE